jgi:hypothetical protein
MTQRIYPHHVALGNRVGLHYSRFWPKLKTSPFVNQILSRPKNLKIRFFDRESAKTGLVQAALRAVQQPAPGSVLLPHHELSRDAVNRRG